MRPPLQMVGGLYTWFFQTINGLLKMKLWGGLECTINRVETVLRQLDRMDMLADSVIWRGLNLSASVR